MGQVCITKLKTSRGAPVPPEQGPDDRGQTSTGDWDSGYYKAECSNGKVVYGVSTTTSGTPRKILCCNH